MELWTIGHSNHPLEKFLELLRTFNIRLVADVRSFPGSRRYPHFGKSHLAEVLPLQDIAYEHFPELGGRRKPSADSLNTGWRNEGFKGYADYMLTGAFKTGIARLLAASEARRTAIMCAEVLWWQCHRALISDWLKAHGHQVFHILATGKSELHPYTSVARIIDGTLSYAKEPSLL